MAAEAPKQDMSRMEATYGRAALEALAKTSVLISGLNGLGVEVAKNVILANTKRVTVHDTAVCSSLDLASQFFLSEADIGKNRAAQSLTKLQELNPAVTVEAAEGDLKDAIIAAKATVVVAVDVAEAEAVAVNEFCRSQSPPIKFIRSDIRGLFGNVFVDFGPTFTCQDTTGENPKTAVIKEIIKGNPGVVKCIFDDDGRHDLENGDIVTFSQVKGMAELNGVEHTVKVLNPFEFSIGDVSGLSDYVGGGIVTQVKQPKDITFKSLKEELVTPGDFQYEPDLCKWARSNLSFMLFKALDTFRAKNGGKHPAAADGDELVKIVKDLNAATDPMHQTDLEDEGNVFSIKAFAAGAAAVLNPMAAIFGGIVGQEVVKAVSAKYHPIVQWFFLDMVECLPKNQLPSDTALNGDRYDSQTLVFGKAVQDKIKDLNYFLVGAGALGCEFIKNFAMMGLASGKGKVTVTDDDIIELSNLSRQFLFRHQHVGQPKSSTAANAARAMNPQFNIEALKLRVSPDTEGVFNNEFWEGLSGVCNALDNVQARRYVDARCVFFGKSLLESGTLGTKANVQVVLPHKTENYGASSDPPEKTAPMCTIHNFPHNIDHTLVWARSEFTGFVEKFPTDTVKFLEEGEAFVQNMKTAGASESDIKFSIRGDKNWGGGILSILNEKPSSFEDCVAWARRRFEHYCVNMIRQLTHAFPEDAMDTTKAVPVPFWSPPKRFPNPVTFDADDEMCMQFIVSCANLRAKTFGIAPPANNRDPAFFKEVLKGVTVPTFEPSDGIKIETDEKKAQEDTQNLESIVKSLPSASDFKDLKVLPDEFEKDDATNFHIDFICALANLRARNYGIDEVDTLTARLKAGRIIPAIATATAMITGFVCLELYKTLTRDDVEAFRNAFVNLALPLWSLSEPAPPAKVCTRTVRECDDPINNPEDVDEFEVKAYPEGHTAWDKLTVDLPATATLQEFITYLKEKYELDVYSISSQKIIYRSTSTYEEDRLGMNFLDLYEKTTGTKVRGQAYLVPTITFVAPDGYENLDTPEVVWKIAY